MNWLLSVGKHIYICCIQAYIRGRGRAGAGRRGKTVLWWCYIYNGGKGQAEAGRRRKTVLLLCHTHTHTYILEEGAGQSQ